MTTRLKMRASGQPADAGAGRMHGLLPGLRQACGPDAARGQIAAEPNSAYDQSGSGSICWWRSPSKPLIRHQSSHAGEGSMWATLSGHGGNPGQWRPVLHPKGSYAPRRTTDARLQKRLQRKALAPPRPPYHRPRPARETVELNTNHTIVSVSWTPIPTRSSVWKRDRHTDRRNAARSPEEARGRRSRPSTERPIGMPPRAFAELQGLLAYKGMPLAVGRHQGGCRLYRQAPNADTPVEEPPEGGCSLSVAAASIACMLI